MIQTLFCERQIGDMCRMHSINNYFGKAFMNESEFFKYCDNYDKIIKGLDSKSMDGFAEGRSIVSYIMDKKFNKFLFLIPINSYKASRNHLDIEHYNDLLKKCNCFFEFNKNHIWVNRKIGNKYYKIDSIGGVNETNVKCLSNNGYFLVIDRKNLYEEVNYLINKITNLHFENDNMEIFFYNLYYSLNKLDLSIKDDDESKFLEKKIQLKNILKILFDFIDNKRKNKNTRIIYYKKNILAIIKDFISF
jgi:hypothetical protein